MTDTKIKSQNLETALVFLERHQGEQFTPDAIKERARVEYEGDGFIMPHTERIICSHASAGRMLRRAEQKGTAYHGLILRRGSVRNATDTDDLATFYLDFPTDEEIKNGRA